MKDEKANKSDIENKHVMAIDYGKKFTGVATFKVGNDPFPLAWGRVAYENDAKLINDLKTIIDDEFVEILVVGVPRFTDGTESTMTKTIKAFAQKYEDETGLPVYLVDETLTTFEAEERMKSDPRYNFQVDYNKIDALCATIILEEFVKSSSD